MHFIANDLKHENLLIEFMILEIERYLTKVAAFDTYLREKTDT